MKFFGEEMIQHDTGVNGATEKQQAQLRRSSPHPHRLHNHVMSQLRILSDIRMERFIRTTIRC